MGHGDPRDDDALLTASACGDGAAFEAFYRRHVAAVLAFLLFRVRSAEVALYKVAGTIPGQAGLNLQIVTGPVKAGGR